MFWSLGLWSGVLCTRQPPQTGCTTCCTWRGRKTMRLRRLSRITHSIKIQKCIISNDFYPSQPNEQARIVAPLTSLSNLERISKQEDARLLLIVRHPFDRWTLVNHQDLNHFSRLVSAFRDKLEQCHGPQNCTLENNWQSFYDFMSTYIFSFLLGITKNMERIQFLNLGQKQLKSLETLSSTKSKFVNSCHQSYKLFFEFQK